MLEHIRERAQGWMAYLILGLIAIPFVFWGVEGYFGTEAPVVARVSNTSIHLDNFRKSFHRVQQQFSSALANSDQMLMQLANEVLENLINEVAFSKIASEEGYRAPEARIIAMIRSHAEFQQNGVFIPERYEAFLRAQGMSGSEFLALLANDYIRTQWRRGIIESSFSLPLEVKRLYYLAQQTRDIQYASIPKTAVPSIEITPQMVRQYYDNHTNQFMAEEQITVEYVRLNLDNFIEEVQPDAKTLEQHYQEHIGEYTEPEARTIRVITFSSNDKKQAIQFAEKLIKGQSFAEQSKGLVVKQQVLVAGNSPLQEAVFTLGAPGDVTSVVEAQEGYQLAELVSIKTEHLFPLSVVQARVQKDYQKYLAQEKHMEKQEALESLLFEHPDSLEEAAKALQLTVETSSWFGRQGGQGIAASPKVAQAAFSESVLQERHNSEIIALNDQEVVALRVRDHKPAVPQTFENVAEKIKSQLAEEAMREHLQRLGKSYLEQLNARKGAPTLQWQNLDQVRRSDERLRPEFVEKVFSAPVSLERPIYQGFSQSDGEFIILQVIRKHEPKEMTAAVTDEYRRMLAVYFGEEEFSARWELLKSKVSITRYPERLQLQSSQE